ncbi:MAG: toxin-antitoxin system HicB family antitoxin [Sphingomonadales bacterium]|nr:toxin-antitoxin system HicB family antitoxin [Sphingomonadales bacterium]MBD3775147.1 toxin-antitoxin system HicB family antitoxin [Paracoccaceae bacterium]
MAEQRKAFPLRLDPAVHAAVERLAAAELRSANAQIEILLREALAARGVEAGRSPRPRRGRPPKDD